jgi:hypothetical protein
MGQLQRYISSPYPQAFDASVEARRSTHGTTDRRLTHRKIQTLLISRIGPKDMGSNLKQHSKVKSLDETNLHTNQQWRIAKIFLTENGPVVSD